MMPPVFVFPPPVLSWGRFPDSGESPMTESEWLASADPLAMIGFLGEERTHFRTRWLGWLSRPKFQFTDRKWHLFYCACVRRVAHLLPVEESRRLIDLLEALADGKATEGDLKTAIAA